MVVSYELPEDNLKTAEMCWSLSVLCVTVCILTHVHLLVLSIKFISICLKLHHNHLFVRLKFCLVCTTQLYVVI